MENIYWGRAEPAAVYDKARFEEFLNLSPEELKEACTDSNGRLKHIIRAEHFDLEFLQTLCATARAARRVTKLEDRALKKLISHKSVLNYFNQPSSRTFLSFSTAEAHLGMRREEVRDLKTSSHSKGESDKDALRTASSYFDALVCRHSSNVYDLFAVWVMKNSNREIPVINAGSGSKEHPTQGLLDYYTMHESFDGKLDNRVIVFVGDCLRGRTIRSLAKIMSLHKNSTFYFVAPEELQMDKETEEYLKGRGSIVHKETKSLKRILPVADVIYMTRVQDEHGGSGAYNPDFIFTRDMLESMREGAILMHPMPKREEIDPTLDYLKKDKRIMYWREQRNGMWTRVALLAYLFGKDQAIRDTYERVKKAAKL